MKKQLVLSKAMSLLLLCGLIGAIWIVGLAYTNAQYNLERYHRETLKNSLLNNELSDRDDRIEMLKQEIEDLKQQIPE